MDIPKSSITNLLVRRGYPGWDRVEAFVEEAYEEYYQYDNKAGGYWVPDDWYRSGKPFAEWYSKLIRNAGLRKWDDAKARAQGKRTYTDAEKEQFLEDAKRVGESIKGMKLSDAAKATLRGNP